MNASKAEFDAPETRALLEAQGFGISSQENKTSN